MRSPFEAKQLYLKLLAVSLVTAFHHDWTITEVSETWMNSSSLQKEPMQIYHHDDRFRRLYMAAACGAREWCKTVCHQGGGGLLLLNLISAARNKDPSGPPLMKCLTNGRRNNIIIAQTGIVVHDSSPGFAAHLNRVPENLLDGVHDYAMDSCFKTSRIENPFVVYDFGSMQEIKSVSLMSQSNVGHTENFHDIDVRVGLTGASGDFSSYTRLGYYTGPSPYPNYEHHFVAEVPIVGKFLSIQTTSGVSHFQLCHLEAY